MKELKDLVVGDDVLITSRYYRRIAKVDKVTKTQIVVDNARFRRDSGWQCVSDSWDRKIISVPTRKYQMLKKRIFARFSSTLSVLLILNVYQ